MTVARMKIPCGKLKLTAMLPVIPEGTVTIGIAPDNPVKATAFPPMVIFMPGVIGRDSNTFPPVDDVTDARPEVSVTTTPASR